MTTTLCRGIYRAVQLGDTIIITACGKHSASGYRVRLQKSSVAAFPPEYDLKHHQPDFPSSADETEFVVWTSFPVEEIIDQVRIHDADGEHEVIVEQRKDSEILCRHRIIP